MKRLLLLSLREIYESHSSEWPLIIEHWPKRQVVMFKTKDELLAHEEVDRPIWRFRGSFS